MASGGRARPQQPVPGRAAAAASGRAAARASSAQASARANGSWCGRLQVLRVVPQLPHAHGGPGARLAGPVERGRRRRGVGEGDQEGPIGRDAAARHAAARRRGARGAGLVPRNHHRSGGRGQPQPGASGAAPAQPRRVPERRSAICWRSTSTRRRCCPPTIRASASTTWPTCWACRRCCSSATSPRPRRSAPRPSAIRPARPPTRPIASGST